MVGSIFPTEIIARREGVLFSILVLLGAIAGYQQMRVLDEEQVMLSVQRDVTAGAHCGMADAARRIYA